MNSIGNIASVAATAPITGLCIGVNGSSGNSVAFFAVVVIEIRAVAFPPFGFTVEGEILHVLPEGAPEQERATG